MNERDHEMGAGPPQVEYRFSIDAYTPATIPMARLAEYMTHLAQVLGEPASVHFARLESGSTVLVQAVAREAIPKVRMRAESVRRGDGPRDAVRAYQTINKLLREDNGVGSLTEERTGVILAFPGREETEETYQAVRQDGSVDGRIIRVGGTQQQVPVILVVDGEEIAGCHADRHVAKQLAQKLFEYVRLYGTGRWRRDPEGSWSLVDFRVTNFEVLREGSLASVVTALREIAADIAPGAYEELDAIRHGPDGRADGGH